MTRELGFHLLLAMNWPTARAEFAEARHPRPQRTAVPEASE
jgi:hypothetical protein